MQREKAKKGCSLQASARFIEEKFWSDVYGSTKKANR